MTATLHKHNWRKLNGFDKTEWRCTNADKIGRLHGGLLYEDKLGKLHAECSDKCQEEHSHFREAGCLGALTYRGKNKGYFFCAPGMDIAETDDKPVSMIIDHEYLARLATFNESLRTLAA